MPVDKFGRMSDTKTRDTGVSLTYINNNYIRSDGTTPVSGSIDMRGNTVYNVPDPVNPQDVATKEYVDDVAKTLTLEEALIKENGGYNVANAYINMNFNNIRNLGIPSNISDAATKGYVDNSINNVVDKAMKQRTENMIVVYSNYCGLLRKGEYQFVFGGNIMLPSGGNCGFLMPNSGRIKKIKLKISHDEGIESFRNLNVTSWVDMFTPDPIFTFTLIKEEKNLTDFLSYNCLKFNNKRIFVARRHFVEGSSITDEIIREINEEREKGIIFLDKWGDKLTLIDKDIACSFLDTESVFTSVDSILNISISEGDILNIRTEKENAAVWGRDISFTYLFTFLIELDPL